MAITTVWLGFTVFFAWNSTLTDPFVQNLLPSKPSVTITALNILSHITVLLLQVLASSVFENLRWVFACTTHGVSSFGFLVMSRATGPFGVLYLLLFNSRTGGFWTGHRLWGLQRFHTTCIHMADSSLWFMILHTVVGIALLTDANFETCWQVSRPLTFASAGLAPFDPNSTSIVAAFERDITPSVLFWYYYSGVLSNSLYVTAIAPQFCSSNDASCFSIFYPGGMSTIYPSPSNLQKVTESALVVYNATGYQLEYSQPTEPTRFNPEDCCVYLTYTVLGIGICIRREGNNLLAGSIYMYKRLSQNTGINLCATADQPDCPVDGTWLTNTPYVVQARISQRNATTVYATSNYTILDLYDISESKPTDYTPKMFLEVMDSAFSINETGDSTNAVFDSMLQLGSVYFQLDSSTNLTKWMGDSVELLAHLERILAVPVLVFNENFLRGANGGLPPSQSSKISGALVAPSYRVIFSFKTSG